MLLFDCHDCLLSLETYTHTLYINTILWLKYKTYSVTLWVSVVLYIYYIQGVFNLPEQFSREHESHMLSRMYSKFIAMHELKFKGNYIYSLPVELLMADDSKLSTKLKAAFSPYVLINVQDVYFFNWIG